MVLEDCLAGLDSQLEVIEKELNNLLRENDDIADHPHYKQMFINIAKGRDDIVNGRGHLRGALLLGLVEAKHGRGNKAKS